jgi:rod shape-determining protein MreC
LGNEVGLRAYNTQSNITSFFHLQQENDSLLRENIQLRKLLTESKYNPSFFYVSAIDTTLKDQVQKYNYTPAKIIKNSIDKTANYIYIDKGYKQGIQRQMGVITSNGVIGQVVDVTENYAAVMSILNKNFKVGAKLKNSSYFGPIRWDGSSAAFVTLDEIPKHVKIKKGDTVVTSGYSDLFPENIVIGRVSKFNAEPEKNFLEIEVKLHTDMQKLTYVYVVTNLMKKETTILDTLVTKIK